jgi:hypothetical protein
MTPFRLGELLGEFTSALAPLIALGLVAMVVFANYLMFSALRNVKLIRLELRRLNEILDSRLSADTLTTLRR